jgi:hypothetical protein
MSDAEILKAMLKDSAIVQLQVEYSKNIAVLTEPQVQDSTAKIHNIPDEAIIIKIDSFSAPKDIFRGDQGECKRADFVIISEEKKCILYIEIKRSKDSWEQIVKQLLGAECVIKYCREVGKSFWNNQDFLKNYKHRFISIGHTSIAKKKTQISKSTKIHDSPNVAMKINWPHHVEFNMLVGS